MIDKLQLKQLKEDTLKFLNNKKTKKDITISAFIDSDNSFRLKFIYLNTKKEYTIPAEKFSGRFQYVKLSLMRMSEEALVNFEVDYIDFKKETPKKEEVEILSSAPFFDDYSFEQKETRVLTKRSLSYRIFKITIYIIIILFLAILFILIFNPIKV
jgi:hypothetical protein